MTNDQTVTQADERAADEWYPDRSATMHRKLAKLLARHRTAHSGDLIPGLERAAQWHDARCKGPSVFEQELHETSAKALRHLAANPDATDMQALDAPQGEVERLLAAMKQAEIHIDCASFRKAQDILLAALAQSEGAKSD